MSEAKKLTPKDIANQLMADEAWHDTLYVRAKDYDLLKAENERLRTASEKLFRKWASTAPPYQWYPELFEMELALYPPTREEQV